MGIKETLKKHTDIDVLKQSMSRLGVSVATAWNPDHRHDEEHEKEQDRIRQEIRDLHRFNSYANVREDNNVGWYSDGLDYFWALSEAIERAEDSIFILDWWLTPELYLRRPPALYPEYRMDRLLKRKAEQGVRIFIIVYKEVTQSMTLSSAHTKHFLEDLHENICVARHPDHLGGEVVLYWSHHDKVVVIDQEVAAVGGLDICFGRWDTPAHPFSDVHPTRLLEATLFPGQDYNNARIEDFQTGNPGSNQQSNVEIGRMPWHDVHAILQGPAALDVAQNFIERWNFVKDTKYRHNSHYPWLAFPHGGDPAEESDVGWKSVTLHPHTAKFHRLGQRFKHPFNPENREWRVERPDPLEPGTCAVQLLRSAGDWSSGILTEDSIQRAYIQLIREANHTIYIENQFFVTSTETGGAVLNQVGAALVERIVAAHQSGKRFKVVIVIPTIPCFAGEFDKTSSIRCIMNYQYKGICRGGKSICERLREAGVNPDDYVSWYNLRGYDRINVAPIKHMEEKSGVTYHEAQVALARIFLGDHGYQSGWKTVAIKKAAVVEDVDGPNKGKAAKIAEIAMPETEDEARDIIRRFQDAAPEDCRHVRDSIATNILHGHGNTATEPWWGPEDERAYYVTEETYIHSKLMIVDDRIVLIGSANLNDRSQCGDRDSETAMVIEDRDMVESTMDGQRYMASKFALTFRKRLWRQHLGMIDKEECTPEESHNYPTPAMKAPPYWGLDPARRAYRREYDDLVQDPLGEEVERIWKEQATHNTEVYDELFHVVPTDKVRTWKDYHAHFPKPPIQTGHIADPSMPLEHIKQRLSTVRGSLVNFPMHFMEDEKLDEETIEVNARTLPIYV
ncbi:uncharacterized protein PFL1_00984 [Pseudozyma flocculosa PF-1]|uniref:Phospholipase n=1 Tax=Pseudozyma flocculosa TaxID=84751 RepID=A0A5C3F9J4_9BASI|nr:uncharacterized protein PFL1_00984 [Pseudozyma flocculosa PF-1]EPQ31651.1 hypothetical protein PFL1_00984 [Pseudozyma flocculosa PF-1]SPO40766.1 related to phospholipase D [Pseudozyma flocculosa]